MFAEKYYQKSISRKEVMIIKSIAIWEWILWAITVSLNLIVFVVITKNLFLALKGFMKRKKLLCK